MRPRAVVHANAVGGKVRSVLVVIAIFGSKYVDGVCAGHGDEKAGGSEDLDNASDQMNSRATRLQIALVITTNRRDLHFEFLRVNRVDKKV